MLLGIGGGNFIGSRIVVVRVVEGGIDVVDKRGVSALLIGVVAGAGSLPLRVVDGIRSKIIVLIGVDSRSVVGLGLVLVLGRILAGVLSLELEGSRVLSLVTILSLALVGRVHLALDSAGVDLVGLNHSHLFAVAVDGERLILRHFHGLIGGGGIDGVAGLVVAILRVGVVGLLALGGEGNLRMDRTITGVVELVLSFRGSIFAVGRTSFSFNSVRDLLRKEVVVVVGKYIGLIHLFVFDF